MNKKIFFTTGVAILLSLLAFIAVADNSSYGMKTVDTTVPEYQPTITDDDSIRQAVVKVGSMAFHLKSIVTNLEASTGLLAFKNDAGDKIISDLNYSCYHFDKWMNSTQSRVNYANETENKFDNLMQTISRAIDSVNGDIVIVNGRVDALGEENRRNLEKVSAEFKESVQSLTSQVSALKGSVDQIVANDMYNEKYMIVIPSKESPATIISTGIDGIQEGDAYESINPKLVCMHGKGPQEFQIYSSGKMQKAVCAQNFGTSGNPRYKFYEGMKATSATGGYLLMQVENGAIAFKGWPVMRKAGFSNKEWQQMRRILEDNRYEIKLSKPGVGYNYGGPSVETSNSSIETTIKKPKLALRNPLQEALNASGSNNAIADRNSNAGYGGRDNHSFDISTDSDVEINIEAGGK